MANEDGRIPPKKKNKKGKIRNNSENGDRHVDDQQPRQSTPKTLLLAEKCTQASMRTGHLSAE